MRVPLLLPHGPYIDAVVRAIGEAGYPAGPDSFTEYDSSDGELMWLEAFIDLGLGEDDQDEDGEEPVRTGLAWKQTIGRLVGDYDGRGRYEHIQKVFADGCVLPAPGAVAAFVRDWFNGGTGWPTPAANDTTPTGGPLPGPVAEALEAGDVTADLARRLAAYWTTA
ncbi:hypothetical protein ACWGB8_17485 [Kitasatospora sp. NPDC054939]